MSYNPHKKTVINSFVILLLFVIIIGYSSSSSANTNADSINAYRLIDSATLYIDNFDIAIDFSHKAITASKLSNCNNCTAESEFIIAKLFYHNSDIDSALYHLQIALKYSKLANNNKQTINILSYISYVNAEIYNFAESIKQCEQGIKLADSLGIHNQKADFSLTKGLCYYELGEYKKTASDLIYALSLFEAESDSVGISSSLISLGLVFASDNNYKIANEYTIRALKICRNLNDLYGVSACLNNLGYFSSCEKNYEISIDYFQKAMVIDKELEDIEGVAISLNNIGDSYKELGDTTLAISYYAKCLSICNNHDYSIESLVLSNLGDVYFGKGELSTALSYSLRSLKIAESKSLTSDMLVSYDLLRKCYAALGDYKNAYNYSILHKQLYDSTFSIDKSRNIQEVISLYNDQQQKSEISNLKEKSTTDSVFRSHLINSIIIISAIMLLLIGLAVFNRNSKKTLQKQKQYFETLLGRSEDFIFVVGKDGLTKYISPSYQRKIGRGMGSREGKDSFEFIHPDDVGNVKLEFSKLARDGQPRTLEFRILDSKGNWIDVSAYGQNLFSDPKIQGIVVNFWDITQRKQNEILIKKNETKFRQIFNTFPDIYFQADLTGVVTEVSPSVEKITGYTRDEIIGINSKEYSNLISDWKKIKVFIDSNPNSFVHDFDTKIITKSGISIDCSFSAETIISDDGVPVGVKGVIRDISSRIAGQKKLQESEQKLKEANISKEKLFSIISHDLIGPIGTNKSIVDLIIGNIDEFSHEEIVSLISSLKPSLDSTFSLIENLLSWARIQQDTLKPKFEKISLNKMVSEMCMLLFEQAKQKSISLNIVGNKPITVLADKNQLDVSLRNLVSNAIKFSNPNSEIIISIDIVDGMAEVKIIDSGIGMSQSQVDDMLFDKGKVNVRRGTNNEKGTGFGLIIVSEFIKNNKGILNAHSKEGEGTTFVVKLPLV